MENQFDEENKSDNTLSPEDELKKLEELIKKSESEIESLDAEIENIEKQIQQKKQELSEVEAKKNEPKVPKILTRKQLKELNEQYERTKEQKLLEIRNNIDAITKAEFEKARLMRMDGQNCSELERKNLEIQALQLEIDALEKEISIKNSIFYENQEKLRDVLANKLSEELKIEKLRKDLRRLQGEKQDIGVRGNEIRSRINAAISQKNRFVHDYDRLSKDTDTINSKLQKSEKLLKVKYVELKNLKDSL